MATYAVNHVAMEMETAPNSDPNRLLSMYEAIKTGNYKNVKQIVKTDETQCFIRFEDGLLPIHLACKMRQLTIVGVLLNIEPKQQLTAVTESEKDTVFHIAASDSRNVVIMKLLLKKCDQETLKGVLRMKNRIDKPTEDADSGTHSRYYTCFLFAGIASSEIPFNSFWSFNSRAEDSGFGYTPVQIAASKGNVKLVPAL